MARQLIFTTVFFLALAYTAIAAAAQTDQTLARLEQQKLKAQEEYDQKRELYYQGKISRSEVSAAESNVLQASLKLEEYKAAQQSSVDIKDADTESPEYFSGAMKELLASKDEEPQRPYPQTRRLKRVLNGSLVLCHLIETNAHIAGEIYLQTHNPLDLERAGKIIKSVKTCTNEAERSSQPAMKSAQGELQKKPTAVNKLKLYVGTWLGLMRSLPRQARSRAENSLFQQRDRQALTGKEGELDAELLM